MLLETLYWVIVGHKTIKAFSELFDPFVTFYNLKMRVEDKGFVPYLISSMNSQLRNVY